MLTNPNMTLLEFAELFGGIELQPHQRELIKRIEAGEQLTVNVFPMSKGGIKSASFGPLTGAKPDTVIIDDVITEQDFHRPVDGGFREKDTRTGEVRDRFTDDTQFISDPWQRRRS